MTDAKAIQENLDETAEAMRSLQTEVEQPLGWYTRYSWIM